MAEIKLPSDAAIMLIVRGQELVAARGPTVLRAGDRVYVFFRSEDRAYLELLFGRREREAG